MIVVGAGHAGCEAAAASARMGAQTALLSMDIGMIAHMSCNPSIGGIAKGHIVREIDAMGGVMAHIADATGIQFRLLNSSRGPAVQAPRCQSDKYKYCNKMREYLAALASLKMSSCEVAGIIAEQGEARGVELSDGRRIGAGAVVLTTGTFLNGLIHIGDKKIAGGRMGEAPSMHLARWLADAGFVTKRLKTGTPPRLAMQTIDFSQFREQKGDDAPEFFSFRTRSTVLPQVSCHIGHTNERVHRLLLDNLKRSALYGGAITGIGPRYCPSIEDKIVKFADRKSHQIVLEPEGLDSDEIYVNGMSTSMPLEVQREMVRGVPGLDRAEIVRPAYAIEYDFVDPTQLTGTLETRRIRRLFHAGQINGTTGYEEAAAQGLIAGINAALRAQGKDGLVLSRTESYIGTLIDDLVLRGTDEPYRMFTSRSEFRLLLRIDNADLRLTPVGYRLGLVPEADMLAFRNKYEAADTLRVFLERERWNPDSLPLAGADPVSGKGTTLARLLRRPGITLADFEALLRPSGVWPEPGARRSVEIGIRYQGYIEQQQRDMEKIRLLSRRQIPAELDFSTISGLSREVQEKLARIRPPDLAAAGRISGVTPAAISILNVYLELRKKRSGDG